MIHCNLGPCRFSGNRHDDGHRVQFRISAPGTFGQEILGTPQRSNKIAKMDFGFRTPTGSES